MSSALSLPLHHQQPLLPSPLQKRDGYISSGLSTSLERVPKQLGPGILQFCSPLCSSWSLKHFTTGGEQGKGSGGCRVEAGPVVLCLAGLPLAQHLVSTCSLASWAHHLPSVLAPSMLL